MRRILLALVALTTMGTPAFAVPGRAPSRSFAPSRPTLPARPIVTRPACRPLEGDAPVRLRFVDAPLHEVLGFFACVTGARFVTHEDLSGRTVDLSYEGPIPLADAWMGLLKALTQTGLEVIVEPGRVVVQRIQV